MLVPFPADIGYMGLLYVNFPKKQFVSPTKQNYEKKHSGGSASAQADAV